jgi:integrase
MSAVCQMKPITPIKNRNGILLRFTVSGVRYNFHPIPNGRFNHPQDLDTARAIATRISNDILAQNFDKTLDRYRIVPKKPARIAPVALLQLWDLWIEALDLPPAVVANRYQWTRVMIAKANPALKDTKWLERAKLAQETLRGRLSVVRSCCTWGVEQGYLESNPYRNLKVKGYTKPIKPFTENEIREIVAGFGEYAPHYQGFVTFMFLTGVRTAESIGLTWRQVDFERSTVTISESMPIDMLGNGYKRTRKGTKTGKVTILNMNDSLRNLLLSIPAGKPSDLIFKSVRGLTISANGFLKQWKKVLNELNIEYRKPYTTRHSLASHAIDKGMSLPDVAYLLGHSNTRMVSQTYGHMINRPNLPDLNL